MGCSSVGVGGWGCSSVGGDVVQWGGDVAQWGGDVVQWGGDVPHWGTSVGRASDRHPAEAGSIPR